MAKSKVAQAKESQGFTKDSPRCSNCRHFSMDTVKEASKWSGTGFVTKEKNKRCGVGGFAVQLSAWCEKHERKG